MHSIFGQMGNVKELFDPDGLKKNIDQLICQHDLNLKLLEEKE